MQHNEGMAQIEDKYCRVSKIYKETQRIISLFRNEYKIGFERIVRCEVNIGEVII
jgi:hypothetical protein